MNKIVKDKKNLLLISVIISLLSLVLTGASIALIVLGANMIKKSMALGIILIIASSILTLIFLIGIVCGIVMFITGKSVVAYNGSIAEDNLAIGTANMLKCKNCGSPVNKDDKFCNKCGNSLENSKQCPHCNAEIAIDSNVCSQCGEKL